MSELKHLSSPVIPQERWCNPYSLWPDAKLSEGGGAMSTIYSGLWIRALVNL